MDVDVELPQPSTSNILSLPLPLPLGFTQPPHFYASVVMSLLFTDMPPHPLRHRSISFRMYLSHIIAPIYVSLYSTWIYKKFKLLLPYMLCRIII
jgi:hypothetical protein